MNRLLPYFEQMGEPTARRRRRARARRRWWFVGLLVAVIAAWAFALQLPGIGRMALSALMLVALAGGILAAAMGLGLLGMGLFALGDRILLRLRRPSPRPKAVDDWWQWN